ncbi:nucleotidyltransferase family protein [Saccharicrinis fermentans]|nr:nucleotidyltransferase family protein [Saccharicrinis fermentans]GAF04920.1 hypothetical protein JCM21142_93642 [Saccharicrinis fermentans DSM 9555 = JCM 21142]
MSNLDILIMGEKATQAFDLLLKNGAQVSGEGAAAHDLKTGHHLPPLLFQGVLIELHTSLFPLDMNHQIPNSFIEPRLIQYDQVSTLPPMLNFCYLCLHAYSTMRRGGIRLSWFLDLVLLSRSDYFQKDETSLSALLQQLKIEKPVMDIIHRAEFLFDYRFPFVPAELRSTMSPDEISDFIHFIHSSGQQDTRYSYAIAFERLKNTKGFINKIRFIKSVIMRGGHTDLASIMRRLGTLSIRSLKMLFFRSK